MNKKKLIIIITAIVLLMAVIAGIILVNLLPDKNSSANVVPWDVDIGEEVTPEPDEILIPGYEAMYMKAGVKTQAVNMGNPADNNCYFVIALKLDNGDKLFESDYLEPGQGIDKIKLNKTLKAGNYKAIIEYKCYTLDGKDPLNGGSAEFDLIVK